MFKKILIANRGEIACRIAETARKIGLTTVGIFSEADINSKHVSLCDDVFLIEGSSPLGCYLDQDKIIEIAVKSKDTLYFSYIGYKPLKIKSRSKPLDK